MGTEEYLRALKDLLEARVLMEHAASGGSRYVIEAGTNPLQYTYTNPQELAAESAQRCRRLLSKWLTPEEIEEEIQNG